jgi:hypothetical protein
MSFILLTCWAISARAYYDVSANQLRGMMRPAKQHESIFIALIDQLGIDPDDIPFWFKRPKRYTVSKRKRQVKWTSVRQPETVTPQQSALTVQLQTPTFPQIPSKQPVRAAPEQQPQNPWWDRPGSARACDAT